MFVDYTNGGTSLGGFKMLSGLGLESVSAFLGGLENIDIKDFLSIMILKEKTYIEGIEIAIKHCNDENRSALYVDLATHKSNLVAMDAFIQLFPETETKGDSDESQSES